MPGSCCGGWGGDASEDGECVSVGGGEVEGGGEGENGFFRNCCNPFKKLEVEDGGTGVGPVLDGGGESGLWLVVLREDTLTFVWSAPGTSIRVRYDSASWVRNPSSRGLASMLDIRCKSVGF